MMVNWFQLIPVKIRAGFYIAYGFATIGVTALAAYYGAIGGIPDWVIGTGAALIPLGTVFAVTASSNTNVNPHDM